MDPRNTATSAPPQGSDPVRTYCFFSAFASEWTRTCSAHPLRCDRPMMRVTRIGSGDAGETLGVEGRLTRESAHELRAACEAALAEHDALELDVSGLRFVDATGVALLHDLGARGIRLAGCSGFIAELLRDPPSASAADRPATERALVARLRDGDPDAFDTVVRQYGGRMLSTARRFVGNEDEAHDVVQESFLAAFRAIGSFAGSSRLSTWLHRIVVNAALMRLRSRRRRREDPIDSLLPRFADDGRWAESPAQWSTPADRLLERRETRAMVRSAIDRLPASYRTILLLRDIEELDTVETAASLGITVNAAKIRLHRSRQALKTLLERALLSQEQPVASCDASRAVSA